MSLRDIPFAISITDLEGWNYFPADFRRLLRLSPKGCFKAVVGGKRVGLTTAVAYGRVGWVGNVIVQPGFRGRGVGGDLVGTAIAYLQSEGVETIRLNSYLETVQFYEDLGFKGEYENIRFTGQVVGNVGSQINCDPCKDIQQVISMDKRFFGANRSDLLSSLSSEFPKTFLCVGKQKLRGYIVGQVHDGFCEIAPWVANPVNNSAAKELWQGLQKELGKMQVAFTAPSRSKQAVDAARWMGLRRDFRTLRMSMGKNAYKGRPEGILGLAGLDKG